MPRYVHTGPSHPNQDRRRGREAYARKEWEDAYQAFVRADRAGVMEPDDLELFAWSAALTGRDDEFLKTLERIHHLHMNAGDSLRAARAALWLTFRLFFAGEMGRATGWLGRAERLIEKAGRDSVEQGYLLLPMANRSLSTGNLQAARQAAIRAAEIGERFADRDLTALARSVQGRALVREGRIDEGMAVLDEVMVSASSGELSALITGIIYCGVIDCCQRVYAFHRSREWTRALSGWCDAQPQLVAFSGACRVHRSEILQLDGAWGESIAEADRAVDRAEQAVDKDALGAARYQQAEIHRLRGEFEAAEEAYREASRLGKEPQPGLALLRLAQGNAEAAAGAIRRVLDATRDPLRRMRFLPAYVEIMLAGGPPKTEALEEARRAAAEIEEIAATYDSEILRAIAAHARGAVRLADGDARGAIEPLRQAFAAWHRHGAPYIAASLRVLVGQACRALGDEEGAKLECDAARAVFVELGAAPDLARLEAVSGEVGGRARGAPSLVKDSTRPHGLTSREMEVLRLIAAGKTNKAIGEALFLSEKTVDRHVSNIFNKIDVSSRAAATAFAYEHKLI